MSHIRFRLFLVSLPAWPFFLGTQTEVQERKPGQRTIFDLQLPINEKTREKTPPNLEDKMFQWAGRTKGRVMGAIAPPTEENGNWRHFKNVSLTIKSETSWLKSWRVSRNLKQVWMCLRSYSWVFKNHIKFWVNPEESYQVFSKLSGILNEFWKVFKCLVRLKTSWSSSEES